MTGEGTEKMRFQGEITWSAPSNIALVKYWGKKEEQLPCNPSLSLTLEKSRTQTTLSWRPKDKTENCSRFTFDFYFHKEERPEFHEKIFSLVERYLKGKESLKDLYYSHHFIINSRNSFPHSTGIASSASSMAALALSFLSFENLAHAQGPFPEKENEAMQFEFWKKASEFARLGSGSACRSVLPYAAFWGNSSYRLLEGESDQYALSIPGLHQIFKSYCDTILIVSGLPKEVSSSEGHDMIAEHPYKFERFKRAHERAKKMLGILLTGNLDEFISLVEAEALDLHALMMSSEKPYILMRPNTLAIIEKVREFRKKTNIPVAFTLDAGPNVHLLYPKEYFKQVSAWVEEELSLYCSNNEISGRYIHDEVGPGPLFWDSLNSGQRYP